MAHMYICLKCDCVIVSMNLINTNLRCLKLYQHNISENSYSCNTYLYSDDVKLILCIIVIGLQDKKYYPTAEEVFGPEVEVRGGKVILLPCQHEEWHLN